MRFGKKITGKFAGNLRTVIAIKTRGLERLKAIADRGKSMGVYRFGKVRVYGWQRAEHNKQEVDGKACGDQY